MNYRNKVKKNNKKLLLILILLIITVWFATLTTTLNINGNSKIFNSTWDIHFESINVVNESVPIDTDAYSSAQAATIDTEDTTKLSYIVLLSEPGDFYEFTVKAVNGGSIDAMISKVESKIKVGTGNEVVINEEKTNIPAYLDYKLENSDGTPIEINLS